MVLHERLPLDVPFQLIMLVSTPCNFKCKYCIQSQSEPSPIVKSLKEKNAMFMDYDQYCRYVDSIAKYVHSLSSGEKIKIFAISGFGETLMNPCVPDMIAYAKKANIAEKILIFTNASLLTHEMADKLVTAGLDILKISIQGVDSNVYKDVCGFDIDFEKLVASIKYMYEHKNNCYIYVKVGDIALRDEREKSRFTEIFEPISDESNIEYISLANGYTYSPGGRHLSVTKGEEHQMSVCNLIFRLLEIQTDGEMYPCARYDSDGFAIRSIGNLSEKSFGEIWNQGIHKQLCEDILRHEPKGLCENCRYFLYLSSGIDSIDGHEKEILGRLSK